LLYVSSKTLGSLPVYVQKCSVVFRCVVLCVESLDEDWEKDFDVEVTEQELQAAKERLRTASAASAVATDGVDDAGKVCTVSV